MPNVSVIKAVRLKSALVLSLAVLLLSGCLGREMANLRDAALPYAPPDSTEDGEVIFSQVGGDRPTELTVTPAPQPPEGSGQTLNRVAGEFPVLRGVAIGATLDSMPLPAFVNMVFGDLLKVDFEIDPAVLNQKEVITLRTSENRPPMEFFEMVLSVLKNYGVGVRYAGGIYRVLPDSKMQSQVPRIIRSRAYRDIPGDLRPIFQFVHLGNVRNHQMMDWIRMAFKTKVQILPVNLTNAVILLGTRQDVDNVLEAIEVLDQPHFAGQKSIRIEPAFWSASALARQLKEILRAEGYYTVTFKDTTGAITFLVLDALNAILVFAVNQETMNHVLEWARDLDRPGRTGDSKGLFYYQVKNTDAEEIAAIIAQLQGEPVQDLQKRKVDSEGGDAPRLGGAIQPRTIVVDKARNGIIFKGSSEDYARLRPLIANMDHAPYEVLIVATVAEVTLSDKDSLGIDWALNTAGLNKAASSVVGSLGSAGLSFTVFDSAREVSAVISALASNSNVSILSSPRLVAKSGTSASMTVGTEIPIITSQQNDPFSTNPDGASNILQQIQYRSTGVSLSITPIVYSGNRVELTVSQSVSAVQADEGIAGNPIIFNRDITTTLTLNDGQTALLGGLISESISESDSGVPFLKDIPFLGNLFRSSSGGTDRTELLVLITPYIVQSPEDSRAILEAFRTQLSPWAREDIGGSQ